jgi:hypothetical protein
MIVLPLQVCTRIFLLSSCAYYLGSSVPLQTKVNCKSQRGVKNVNKVLYTKFQYISSRFRKSFRPLGENIQLLKTCIFFIVFLLLRFLAFRNPDPDSDTDPVSEFWIFNTQTQLNQDPKHYQLSISKDRSDLAWPLLQILLQINFTFIKL